MSKKSKISKSAANNIEIKNIIVQLDNVRRQRQSWEDSLKRASDQSLYEILAHCYEIFLTLRASSTLKKKLTEALKSSNATSTAATSLQVKIIRYVFNTCPDEYAYAKTIVEAEKHKPADVPFAEWLKGQGGPSGIKRHGATSKPKPKKQEYVDIALAHFLNASALSTIAAVDNLSANRDADHDYAVALVRPSASDPTKLEIVYGSNKQALVNTVLEHAAKSLSDIDRQAVLSHAEDNDDVDLAEVIKLQPKSASKADRTEAGAQV